MLDPHLATDDHERASSSLIKSSNSLLFFRSIFLCTGERDEDAVQLGGRSNHETCNLFNVLRAVQFLFFPLQIVGC